MSIDTASESLLELDQDYMIYRWLSFFNIFLTNSGEAGHLEWAAYVMVVVTIIGVC